MTVQRRSSVNGAAGLKVNGATIGASSGERRSAGGGAGEMEEAATQAAQAAQAGAKARGGGSSSNRRRDKEHQPRHWRAWSLVRLGCYVTLLVAALQTAATQWLLYREDMLDTTFIGARLRAGTALSVSMRTNQQLSAVAVSMEEVVMQPLQQHQQHQPHHHQHQHQQQQERDTPLAVLIITRRSARERRQALRDTWVAELQRLGVPYRFVVGKEWCDLPYALQASGFTCQLKSKHGVRKADLRAQQRAISAEEGRTTLALEDEQSRYGDLMVLEGVVDSYGGLANKTLQSLAEAVTTLHPRPRWVFKTDDDVVLRGKALLDFVLDMEARDRSGTSSASTGVESSKSSSTSGEGKGRTSTSEIVKNARAAAAAVTAMDENSTKPKGPVRRVVGAIATNVPVLSEGKWAEFNYPKRTYPAYPRGGAGYLLSREAARTLARHRYVLPSYTCEDAAIGIWFESIKTPVEMVDTDRMDVSCFADCCEAMVHAAQAAAQSPAPAEAFLASMTAWRKRMTADLDSGKWFKQQDALRARPGNADIKRWEADRWYLYDSVRWGGFAGLQTILFGEGYSGSQIRNCTRDLPRATALYERALRLQEA